LARGLLEEGVVIYLILGTGTVFVVCTRTTMLKWS
jgi:hypothetical protein